MLKSRYFWAWYYKGHAPNIYRTHQKWYYIRLTLCCDVIEKVGHWQILWNEWSEISSAVVKLKCKPKQPLGATTVKGQLMWYHTCGTFMKTENAIISWIRVSPGSKWNVINVWNVVAMPLYENKRLIRLNCIASS